MNNVTTEVYSIVAKKSGKDVDNLTDDMTLEGDLEMTPLEHVELIMKLEDAFELEFPDDEFLSEKPVSLADIISHIEVYE